jgi:hypothetical protein
MAQSLFAIAILARDSFFFGGAECFILFAFIVFLCGCHKAVTPIMI